MSNSKILDLFYSNFKEYGDSEAIIFKGNSYSYNYLIKRINFWRSKLDIVKQGEIVGLEGDFSPETISILFLLIEKLAVVVPLDIHHQDKNERKYAIAQLDLIIRVYDEENIEITNTTNTLPKHDLYAIVISKKVPGLVLFTSGSSGDPKAALHDFNRLLAKFNVKRKALKTINFLLFDHWGGLNTLFHVLSNGGTVVVLENRNPDYVCKLIEQHAVELLPTSPTFLNMLIISRAYERFSLKSLKVISYGAEPMPPALLELLNKIFTEITLQQTYGLIELGVMRSKSEDNGSLWVKIGGEGYQVRVVDNLLQIKSESAMLGYLNAPSPFTDDGWFMTGDSVEVKGDYFRILGRKSEIINVGGEKVYPQEVENTILGFPNIQDVVVYAEKNPLTGQIVCAKINLENPVEDSKVFIKELKMHCRINLEPFKIPVKVIIEEGQLFSHRFKKTRRII
jgi:long-chain acyl-CoA synthetase